MSDVGTIVLVLVAIPIAAVAFVWALRHEDRARITAGRPRLLMAGYQTRAGWIMAVALVLLALFLLTRP